MPRNFLFWSVKQWGYDWGYSNAYIEVLCTDTIIIDYGDKKKVSKYDIEETKRKWEEKQKRDKVNPAWGEVKQQNKK